MTTRSERYTFSATVAIPMGIPLAEAFQARPSARLLDPSISGDFLVCLKCASKSVVIDAKWALDLPYDEQLFSDACGPVGPNIFLPGAVGFAPMVLHPSMLICDAIRGLILRISRASNSPQLLETFDNAPYEELVPIAHVRVAGKEYELPHRPFNGVNKMRGGFSPPPVSLTLAELDSLVSAPTNIYHHFGARADKQRYLRMDMAGAVVWLTTELETAAYHCLGSRLAAARGKPTKPYFKVIDYLGTNVSTIANGASLKSSQLDVFIACEELWGARHEIVHEGRMRIRTYSTANGKIDADATRPLTGDDVEGFRKAVRAAVAWMERA